MTDSLLFIAGSIHRDLLRSRLLDVTQRSPSSSRPPLLIIGGGERWVTFKKRLRRRLVLRLPYKLMNMQGWANLVPSVFHLPTPKGSKRWLIFTKLHWTIKKKKKKTRVFGIGGLRFSVDISKPSASALLDFQTHDNIWTTQPSIASWFQMLPCVWKSNGWNHRSKLEIITKWGERCVMPQIKEKQVFKFLERYDFF